MGVSMVEKIIEVDNVSMNFIMTNDRISSIKEYMVKKVKGQIKKN